MTREQEIQERLGKATPGPWRASKRPDIGQDANDNYAVHSGSTQDDITDVAWLADTYHGNEQANAAFIAHAPDDIAYLLARVEKLEAERAVAIGEVITDICELPDRTSPEDETDMMLVTARELAAIIGKHFTAAQATDAQRDARLVEWLLKRHSDFTFSVAECETELASFNADDAAIQAAVEKM